MKNRNSKNQMSKKQIAEQARQKQAANDRKAFIVLGAAAAIILLVIGASALYDKLGDGHGSNQLVTLTPGSVAETNESGSSEKNENSVTGEKTEDQTETKNDAEKAPGEMQYDFTMYDEDGNAVKLSDYLGKPIVLNFWASWCGPCRNEMPDFNEKYLELGESVTFIMLNATAGNDTVESAKAFVDSQGFSFPVMYDLTGEAMYVYGISSFPTTFFIDKDGNIVAYANGGINADTLQSAIDMITK